MPMSTLPATHNDSTFNSDSEWNDIDSVQSSTSSPRISIDSHSKVTLPFAANSPTTPSSGRNGTFRNIRNLKILLPLRQSSNNLLEPSHPSPNSKTNVFRPQSPVNTSNSNHYAPSTNSVPSSMKSPAAAAHLLDEVLSHLSPKRTESGNSLSSLVNSLDANRAHVGIDSHKDSPALSKKTLGINENFAAKIGDYIVEQTIGEGSYGKVKLATHTITGEKVALKILDKAAINRTSTSAERVLREIVVLKSLYHPNICQLLQVIDYSRDIYLVFKFEEGGELYHHIVKNGRLKERKARKIFIQILGAIQYCHANGIVHRDLKLENILMDSQGNIKIIDFGFTNIMQAGELLSTFCGSAAYAAPEMISGQKYTGPEVDVWSMGIILYALVCGALPFDDPNVSKMFMKIMKGDLHYPKHLSKDCKDLISHILKLSPAERYTVEQIRDHPWITKDGTTVTWRLMHHRQSVLYRRQAQ
ncbi:kinase-like domain-containing protein [Paraphysoderma sedebokerense]|nr:kinase-like domain-containing protein [Paraphysoderma sedebokerense]